LFSATVPNFFEHDFSKVIQMCRNPAAEFRLVR
jgi:hypothetical protein